ncbi:MAG: hypothetical protein WC412_03905 [Candidatus Omnitrophota bacterium]
MKFSRKFKPPILFSLKILDIINLCVYNYFVVKDRRFFIKKAIFFLTLIIIIISAGSNSALLAQTNELKNGETITIATYYPAPYGIYKSLRLYPDKEFKPAEACSSKGEMVYNNSDNHVYVCDGSKWSNLAMPLVIYAQDRPIRTVNDVVASPEPVPTFDGVMILQIPMKAQETVRVSFSGMIKGPGYTGVWLTSGDGELVSGWMPSPYIGALGNDWVPFSLASFWKATKDGVFTFQQGFYKPDFIKTTAKDNTVTVSGRFASAEKVYLMPSE